MEVYKVQLIETFFCITIFLCLKIVVRYIVRLTVLNDYFKKAAVETKAKKVKKAKK